LEYFLGVRKDFLGPEGEEDEDFEDDEDEDDEDEAPKKKGGNKSAPKKPEVAGGEKKDCKQQ